MSINALYDRARAGGKRAEEELFKKLHERFYQFANHRIWDEQDSEEVVQEALTAIARDYKDIEIETSFSAWAYKVLDNRILSYIGKRRREEIARQSAENMADGHYRTQNPGLRMKLLNCLGKINEANRRHARILVLSYQGYSADEICERLALSKSNLYVLLFRARAALERCLKNGKTGNE